jgi:hypothetical protein
MTAKALSNRAQKAKAAKMRNWRYRQAMLEYAHEQLQPHGVARKSIRAIATTWKVDNTTLGRYICHRATAEAFNAGKQNLTVAEEHVLVDFLKESADRGFPCTLKEIESMANAMLISHPGEPKFVGKCWVQRFLTRHRNELQQHWSKPLDMQRAQSLNPMAKEHWFNHILKPLVIDKNVEPEMQFAIDETAVIDGNQGRERVVGARGTKTQHKQGGGDHGENTTAIITICADGSYLQPTLIFKAKRFRSEWNQNNVAAVS